MRKIIQSTVNDIINTNSYRIDELAEMTEKDIHMELIRFKDDAFQNGGTPLFTDDLFKLILKCVVAKAKVIRKERK